MLAVFPALAAFVSTFALIADPSHVRETAIELSAFMPPEAGKLLIDALNGLVEHATSQSSLGLILGVLVALWSARAGLAALMTGLNIAYEEMEKRSFIEQQIVALLLTLGALVFAAIVVVALGVIPLILAFLPRLGCRAHLVRPRALADPRGPHDGRHRGALPLRAEPQGAQMAMGEPRRDRRDPALAPRLGGFLALCDALRLL